jgi:ABC-type sugar transport system permease subunit
MMAFQDYRYLIPESRSFLHSFNGFDNWIEMANDPMFWHSFKVAVFFTLGTFPANLVVGMACAVMISSMRNEVWATFTRVIAYLPVILPVSVAMLIWGMMFDQNVGYLTYAAMALLPLKSPPAWLGFGLALPSTMVAYVWTQFGFNTILFLVGLYGINRELYEAAMMDGANGWDKFVHITIPGLIPTLTLIFVLEAGIVSATVPMMILTNGGPADETLTAGLYLYRHAFTTLYSDMRMGYAATINLLLGIIHMVMAGLVFKFMRNERA